MKNLTSHFLKFVSLGFLLISLSCNPDDSPRLRPFDAQVEVSFPDDFQTQAAGNTVVTFKNLSSGVTQQRTTDAAGMASFEELLPGNYELSASISLDSEEALELAGFPIEINLNYLNNNLQLTEEVANQGPIQVKLSGSVSGGLVIKQVYYAGSKTPEGGNYFFDQFFEIYNNSSEAVALDGLILSNIYGTSGLINPNSAPTPFQEDENHVYISTAWQFPGSGEQNILQPFTSVVVAQQGINHQAEEANPNSPVNLSQADFELFVVGSTRDIDAPNVPNMEMLYHPFNATFSLVPVFGPGTIIWRTDDFAALEQVSLPDADPTFPRVVKVPNSLVLDAVEALRSENDGSFKRIPTSLDAGFAHVSDTYTGESIIRKSSSVDGNEVYQDTNNSQNDFEVLSTPEIQ